MPRQDVPYGGALCRLKERIAEIWDELGKKLHSINGVEGDAAGDVKIVSGDAAIVVTSDQVNHQIEVALDSSQLPAAAVSSVNGQTGVVALTADDIPSDNGDVQTDLDNLAAADGTLQGNINVEALARQGADATLQGNINTLSASIPTAAATAVANDPTVAQLATDIPNKLDKIVSGSTLKAYTHTGASQGETSIVDGTTANSIGIRDANGRMQAADPASGATDKTLVTANWISQTGSGRPNNVLHNSGNETKAGDLQMSQSLIMTQFGLNSAIRLKTPADRTNFNSVFGDMLNWDDNNGERVVSVRFSQSPNGTIRLEWLFHKPDGTQVSIGSFGMDVNGQAVTTGIFA